MKEMDLFCFPFAGGNKYSYRVFEQWCPPFLKLATVEYPGRGARLKEPFITEMDVLVDCLYQSLKDNITEKEYAFYGHSMGGVVAFFMIKKLMAAGFKPPVHLFITSTTGPSAPPDGKNRFLMTKPEFISEIRSLDGCPEEILQDNELLEYFEPILRADFQVSETFTYRPGPVLDIPFTIITGTEEDMREEDIRLWQDESNRPVDFRYMPGKHFFIYNYGFELLEIISRKLLYHDIYVSYE